MQISTTLANTSTGNDQAEILRYFKARNKKYLIDNRKILALKLNSAKLGLQRSRGLIILFQCDY